MRVRGNLGDSQEAGAQEGQKSAPQGKCKVWFWEIERVGFEFAGVKGQHRGRQGMQGLGFGEIARVPLSQVGKKGGIVVWSYWSGTA